MPSRQTTIVTLLVLAGCLSAGTTTGCTGHSCSDVAYTCGQTRIALQSKSDAWAAGTYALTADEQGGGSATCTMAGHFQMLLSLGTVVSSATVHLVANGTTLVGATVRPAATTTEPNGPGCGECTNASAMLSAD